jgi:hypothetical protein
MTKMEMLSKAAEGEMIVAQGRYHLLTMNDTRDTYTLWSYAWFDEEPYVWSPRRFLPDDQNPIGAFEEASIALSQHEIRAVQAARLNA